MHEKSSSSLIVVLLTTLFWMTAIGYTGNARLQVMRGRVVISFKLSCVQQVVELRK